MFGKFLNTNKVLLGGKIMAEEKPLEKMTVKELKEIALEMEEIQGVSAMKKDELVAAIKEAKGIPLKEVKKKEVGTIVEVKAKMKELREKKGELREKKDKVGRLRLKRRINRLKKRTRKLAKKPVS
jgi:hypothetical protein